MRANHIWLCLLLVGTLTVSACVGRVYKIESHSMEPGLPANTYVTVAPIDPAELKRGDVIVYELSGREGEFHAKRIIGLPGEMIEIHDGAVYVDGNILDESYPVESLRPFDIFGPELLEDNEYFVLGDNRPNSSDSRRTGPVAGDAILGKVVITPWNQFLNFVEGN